MLEHSNSQAGSNTRIPSLDGLRGVAIIMVLVGHGAKSFPHDIGGLAYYLGNGGLGVSIFFALSGFLIYRLSIREVANTGKFNWKQFYARRALRIFPCFYFYILSLLVLISFGIISLSTSMLVSAGTFTINYRHIWDHSIGDFDYPVIGHYWTLALEEQFYLAWPFLIVLFKRKILLPILASFIVLAPLVRVFTYFLMPGSREQIGMMFHTGFDSIAAGVVLGEILRSEKWAASARNIYSSKIPVLMALVFLLFISPLLSNYFRGAYSITIGKTLEIFSICVVIAAAISLPDTILYRILNFRPLMYIGVLSYSLYVWNNLFLLGNLRWVSKFPFNFLLLIGIALFSHYLIEIPFLKLKDRILKPRGSPLSVKQIAAEG